MAEFSGARDYKRKDYGEVSKRKVFVGNLPFHTSWQNLKDHMKTAGTVEYADIFRDRQGKSKGCGYVEFSTEKEAQEAIKTINETEFEGRIIYLREDLKERSRSREFNRDAPRGGFGGRRGGDRGFGGRGRGGYAGDRDKLNSEEEPEFLSGGRGGPRRPAKGRSPGYDSEDEDKYDRSRSRSKSRKEARGDIKGYMVIVKGLSMDVSWQDLKDNFKKIGRVVRADVTRNRDSSVGLVYFDKKSDACLAVEKMNDSIMLGARVQVRAEF